MPKARNNTTTVRLYNLAKKKEQQRIKSNDPGERKGSNVSPRKLMQQIGVETKKRYAQNAPKATKKNPKVRSKKQNAAIALKYKGR